MEIIGIISILVFCGLLALALYIIGLHNKLARMRAKILEGVSNITAFKTRRKRVNRDVSRYARIACRHEQKAIKMAATRGRGR